MSATRNFPCCDCGAPLSATRRDSRCQTCTVARSRLTSREWKRRRRAAGPLPSDPTPFTRRKDALRYAAKRAAELQVIAETGGSPYDRAVRRIERLTGIPASQWEHDSRHPYTRQAMAAARVLAGIVTHETAHDSRERAA